MMVWSAVENGGLTVVSFLSLVIYSRFLSPADFGLFSIVNAIVELLGLFVGMLFHDALIQRPEVTPLHFDSAFTFTLFLSVVLFAGCALCGPLFAHIVGNPLGAGVLTWTALYFPATAITATVVPQQKRRLQFRRLALRSLVGRISGAVLGIALVAGGAGIWGLVAQQVLIALVRSLVLWVTADEHPRLRFRFAEFRSVVGFGLYALGGVFLTFSISRIFTIVAGVALGTKRAGYLNLSFRAVDMLWALASTTVLQVALPVMSRLQSQPERLRRAYASGLSLACLTLFPCFVGIAMTAPEIVELLFGRAWLPSCPYITALALVILVRAPKQLGPPVLTAVGRPQDTLISAGVEMAVMLALLAISGARSLPWVVAIWAAREILPAPVLAFLLKRASGIRYVDQVLGALGPLAASAAMGASLWVLRAFLLPPSSAPGIRLVVLIPAAAAVYLGVAYFIDRQSVVDVLEFAWSATRRNRDQPALS
jgi:PST family polysaccharide transporter